ncbi:hypothetical protein WAI453_009050 [Rhynchosporium graminicola]
MLFLSPIIFLLSLYLAVVCGLLYLLFTTLRKSSQKPTAGNPKTAAWRISVSVSAFFLAQVSSRRSRDATVVRMTKANNGVCEPEIRMPTCIIIACFIPMTFFWYGWSAYKKAHQILPILGLILFGFGTMDIFIPIQTYTIDSFPTFAASGVAALVVSRCLFGAFLPLAGPIMYEALGLGL